VEYLGWAEAGVVGDLKVGVARAFSVAGEWATDENTDEEATDGTVDAPWSKKVLIGRTSGDAEMGAHWDGERGCTD